MTLPWPDNAHEIEHEIAIQAPASKVWQFLVDAEQRKKLSWVGGALAWTRNLWTISVGGSTKEHK